MKKLSFNLCIAFLASFLMNFVTPAFSSPTPTPTTTIVPTPTVTVTPILERHCTPVSATTGTATNITFNSATLNGSYNNYGNRTEVWFEYYPTGESYITSYIESSDSNVSADVNGLTPSTTYYYRTVVVNIEECYHLDDYSIGYGEYNTFTTLPICDANLIIVSSDNIILNRKKSVEVTVTVKGENDCLVDGETVATKINNVGKKCISILPKSATTDENGEATFVITAKNKTGNARITFKAGNLKKSIIIKVRGR